MGYVVTDPLAQGMYRRIPGEGHAAQRGPNGRRLCRWCATEVPKGRRTFCGKDECVHEWSIRRNPAYARNAVFRRDKGVCADCGLDVAAFQKALLRWYHARWDRYKKESRFTRDEITLGVHFHGAGTFHGDNALRRLGFNQGTSGHWQMDHIVPVVEGGGGCGLEGLRTLCTPCHKRVTRELRHRLSAKHLPPRG